MCEYLEVYLSLCSFSTELKVSEDVLKGEVENMKHKYEDMMMIVSERFDESESCVYTCIVLCIVRGCHYNVTM